VTDTVAGLLALARSSESGPVNIGNPHEQTVLEIACEIARLVGQSASIDFIPAVEDDPRQRCPDITLARAALGWAPAVGVDDGLQRTIAWFTEAGETARSDLPIGGLAP
jgi:dTDP-glucose 4,6-dehydratase